jgi:F420-dependent oxidoreductase-like protein
MMRLSMFLDPQEGMTYSTMLAAAQATERGGFYGLYRSDHLAPTSGLFDRNATEAWTTLAGLARETSRIRLGTLITPLTFREPAVLSKMASTVAEMSGGRVDVSIGTGWNTGEHEALGLEFESLGVRFKRLEENAQILTGFWGDEPFSFDGTYYSAKDILPRPLPRPRPRIIIGGHGPRKTPLLAARYADDYNIDWPSPKQCTELFGRLEGACKDVGRDPGSIERSVLLGIIVGETQAELRRVVPAGIGEMGGTDPDAWLAENDPGWKAGTPDDIIEWLQGYEAVGVEHVMLMYAPHGDVSAIDLLAREVLPAFDDGTHR